MAKCMGSLSLLQTLPKSAEHTNCLLRVTERDTDGVTKYQKPAECLVTLPDHEAGRSVNATYPVAREGYLRTETDADSRSRAQDTQNWK